MRTRHALALALTTGLAFGCASADAQEGQDKPVPAPPEKQAGDPAAAETWREVAADDFLGSLTWEMAERLGYDRSAAPTNGARTGRGPWKPARGTARSELGAGGPRDRGSV